MCSLGLALSSPWSSILFVSYTSNPSLWNSKTLIPFSIWISALSCKLTNFGKSACNCSLSYKDLAMPVQVFLIVFEYSLLSLSLPVLFFVLNFKTFQNLHNSFKCYINNLFSWTTECNLPTWYPITPYNRQGYFPM